MDLNKLVSRLSILDKRIGIVKLEPNWAQREFLEAAAKQLVTTGKVRIIVLKARQLGLSTITEALLYVMCFLYEHYRVAIVAHEVPASQNLLEMTDRYWQTDPFHDLYTTKYAGKNHLQWVETNSSLRVATAGNQAMGRSATIHGLHASEVAFWPAPELVMLGLRQTVPSMPGTIIVIESTANGMGNYFHKTWVEAENGESEFIPLFFPWHKHPEYKASSIGMPVRQLTAAELDDEEVQLRNMGVSDDRLIWRRYMIRDYCQGDVLKFKQEYPSTPDEAFIASGTNVFPHKELSEAYEPEQGNRGMLYEEGGRTLFKQASDGPLTVFRRPSEDQEYGQYMVTGDPTHTTRGDYACVQVINRRTLEQVAEWRGRIDPVTFADVIFNLGMYYNTAIVCNEIEGPGYSTIGALIAKNYPRIWNKARPDSTPGKVSTDRFGWSTTMQSKHFMVGLTIRAVVDGSVTIHSPTLYKEMKNYVTLENGSYGPADNDGYDDTVMAFMQGLACHFLEVPVAPHGFDSEVPDGSLAEAPWERWGE